MLLNGLGVVVDVRESSRVLDTLLNQLKREQRSNGNRSKTDSQTSNNSKSSQSRTKDRPSSGRHAFLVAPLVHPCEHQSSFVSERCRYSPSSHSKCEKTWIKCSNRFGTTSSRLTNSLKPHKGCLEMEQGSWKQQLSRRSGTVSRMDIPAHVFKCILLTSFGGRDDIWALEDKVRAAKWAATSAEQVI